MGGCRHRCKVDGERVSEQRWDFFPSLFFFSSLSIYSSRAAECHLLSHNWSRNERCLFVAASVCLCVCVSEYITSGCINSGIFLTYTLTYFLNNYYCITIIILDVWFIDLLDQLLLNAGYSRLAEGVLDQQFAVPTITGRNTLWRDRLSIKGKAQLTHTLRPRGNSVASINLELLEKNHCA